eukprot:935484-Pyramimonas_sp.AAC.1
MPQRKVPGIRQGGKVPSLKGSLKTNKAQHLPLGWNVKQNRSPLHPMKYLHLENQNTVALKCERQRG